MVAIAPMEFGICVRSSTGVCPFMRSILGLNSRGAVARWSPARSRPIAYSEAGYRVVKLQAPSGERVQAASRSIGTRGNQTRRPFFLYPERPGPAFLSMIVSDLARLDAGAGASRSQPFGRSPHIVRWEPDLRVAIADDPEGNAIELCQFDRLSRYRAGHRAEIRHLQLARTMYTIRTHPYVIQQVTGQVELRDISPMANHD